MPAGQSLVAAPELIIALNGYIHVFMAVDGTWSLAVSVAGLTELHVLFMVAMCYYMYLQQVSSNGYVGSYGVFSCKYIIPLWTGDLKGLGLASPRVILNDMVPGLGKSCRIRFYGFTPGSPPRQPPLSFPGTVHDAKTSSCRHFPCMRVNMAKDAFAEKDDAMTGWGENRHVEGEGRGWNFLIRGAFQEGCG